ncbi:hypothetical protein RFI_17968, partial [Reticulomyxa filosa]
MHLFFLKYLTLTLELFKKIGFYTGLFMDKLFYLYCNEQIKFLVDKKHVHILFDFNHWLQMMMNRILLAILCPLVLLSPLITADNRYASLSAADVANEVVQEFVYGYSAYQQYAWGHDELLPLTSSYVDYSSGYSTLWTPIDALDTIYIMNLTDLAEQTKDLICNFSFNINANVAEFDMTIRLLGGLLSAYHFSGEVEKCLLDQAIDLGL